MSREKSDVSVDNDHTHYGLTNRRDSSNQHHRNSRLRKNFGQLPPQVMSSRQLLPMNR